MPMPSRHTQVAGRRRNPTSGSSPSRARQDVLTGAGRGAAAGERASRRAVSGRISHRVGRLQSTPGEYSGTGVGATETGGPQWNSSAGSWTARFLTILRVAWDPSPRASGLSRTTRLSGSRESRSLRVAARDRTALGSGRLGGSTRPSRAERPSITVTPLDFATVVAYDESTSRGRGAAYSGGEVPPCPPL